MHVIGTAGHVDHGKSTLVTALTGMDPDRLAEEKERGLTIDLGFAWLALPSGREIGIVDVPGHERFIRNMLAGVGSIDAALFVVAADEGWMPQSAEHLTILDFLQVRTGVVALTKADLVDTDRLAEARRDVTERLRGTALEGAPVQAVSAATGQGLDVLLKHLDAALADVGDPPDRDRPRLFVDRSFTITGAGTVVTGTLTGGRLRTGDEIELLPDGERARVRTLQTHRRPVDEAVPGSRVAINLAGLERREAARGDAVVRPGDWKPTDAFAARLRAANALEHPLTERGAYEIYVGSAEMPCRIKFLEDAPVASGRAPALGAGQSLLVQVFCVRPVPLEPGDRFIVRDVGRWETVAGGTVLDHFPGRVRRGDPEVLDRLRAREQSDREDLVLRLVAERQWVGRKDLVWLVGAAGQQAVEAIARAVATARAVTTPSYLLDPGFARRVRDRTVDELRAHHATHRLEPGMGREALRQALGLDPKLFAELVAIWAADGAVVVERAVVRLPEHGLSLSAEEESRAAAALAALRAGGASPLELADVGLDGDLAKALERRGDLVPVTAQIAYPADRMDEIKRAVVRLAGQGPFTVAQFRDAVGTTRKYAVPLLEHLDATGFTRRQDDVRVLGPRGREFE